MNRPFSSLTKAAFCYSTQHILYLLLSKLLFMRNIMGLSVGGESTASVELSNKSYPLFMYILFGGVRNTRIGSLHSYYNSRNWSPFYVEYQRLGDRYTLNLHVSIQDSCGLTVWMTHVYCLRERESEREL